MKKRQSWTATTWTTPMLVFSFFVAIFTQPSTAATMNVTCNTNGSIPKVNATFTEQEPETEVTLLSFLPEYFSPKDAVQNCQNTAKTLQTLYNTNRANYLTNDKVSSKSVVCIVERRGIGCAHDSAQVLFTLDSTANSSQALYKMLGSDFKQAQAPDARTVSRIYSDIKPKSNGRHWWLPF